MSSHFHYMSYTYFFIKFSLSNISLIALSWISNISFFFCFSSNRASTYFFDSANKSRFSAYSDFNEAFSLTNPSFLAANSILYQAFSLYSLHSYSILKSFFFNSSSSEINVEFYYSNLNLSAAYFHVKVTSSSKLERSTAITIFYASKSFI